MLKIAAHALPSARCDKTEPVSDQPPKDIAEPDKQKDKGGELPYANIPPLREVTRPETDARVVGEKQNRSAPAYKILAPVQANLPAQRLGDKVFDSKVTTTLRQLLGYSDKLRGEIDTEITSVRVPIRESNHPLANFMAIGPDNGYNLSEDYQVGCDPYLQFYQHGEREVPLVRYVSGETENLRSVWPRINGIDAVEAILDSCSQIVSISEAEAIRTSLSLDPEIVIDMQSANKSVDRTLGLARNVPFSFNGLTVYLQVHIIRNPTYTILLGRTFLSRKSDDSR